MTVASNAFQSTPGPRMFLSAMIIWGGLTCILLNPAHQGPVSQFAAQWAQNWMPMADQVQVTPKPLDENSPVPTPGGVR